jgi:very-long-chain enoyl-CoA reductase
MASRKVIELTIAKRSSGGKQPDGKTPFNSEKSGTFPKTIQLSSDATISDVKKAIVQLKRGFTSDRQRLTTEDKRALLDDSKTLTQESIKTGDTIYVKDLGPQVAWKTVFLTEYFGPLFIHPLIYQFAPTLWRTKFEHSTMQQVALGLVLIHYLKREYETLFVHRFSNATMPQFNIFKNSFHYWILSGVLLAGGVYSPYYSQKAVQGTIQDNPVFLAVFSAVFLLGQLGTGWAHQVLRNLRRPGTKERNIPRGGLFEFVSCPNYFFEHVLWIAFTILTLNPAAALFTLVSSVQMVLWALKKHKNYRKEFKDYPRKRTAIFPFVL